MQTFRLIFGIPAIVLVFLPYVWGVSPWDAVRSWNHSLTGMSGGLLGLPFFLAIPIFVVDVQLFLEKSLPKSERVILLAAFTIVVYTVEIARFLTGEKALSERIAP